MCSSTSAAITRSNAPSGNGIRVASPRTVRAAAPAGTSPACGHRRDHVALTPRSSPASASSATTDAPRRSASNACRPAPQPRSSTRSPGADRQPAEVDGQHGGPRCGTEADRARRRAGREARHRLAVLARPWPGRPRARRTAPAPAARPRRPAAPARRASRAGRGARPPAPRGRPVPPAPRRRPSTSGSAPVRLAISGVPEAMCSTAGSENPSYSEGTTAISALATARPARCR